MTDQPHRDQPDPDVDPAQDRGETAPEELSDEGVGMGMSQDDNSFEPEEAPEAVDEPDRD